MDLTPITEVPSRVLAVYAHPDDADVSCGGALARWAALNSEVHVLICAAGDKGAIDDALTSQELIALRVEELNASAQLLGVTRVHRLGYLDGEIENDVETRRELVRIMREVRPSFLVCPDPLAVFFGEHYYNHRDHRSVGFAALDAASPAAAMGRYFTDCGLPHSIDVALLSGSLESNVFVDISDSIDAKARAVACHRSQLGDFDEDLAAVVWDRAKQAGEQCGVGFAESFRRIRLSH